jgi:O-antigen biosynthesis protein
MANKTFVARPLNDVSEFNSQVDIVVPFHGQYEKVTQLMESVFRLTRSNFYRLIVVDDCSPNAQYVKNIQRNADKNAERHRHQPVLATVRNETQLGFGGACRAGYEAGESPYVCFLQSDCLIKDAGWLRSMGETLLKLKGDGVRVVSATTDNPLHGDPAQRGELFGRSAEDAIVGDDSHLSLHCFMCHRDLFPKIGGFLKEYPYGYYEDEEFAARLRKHGFKQAVSRNSWVHHEGEATVRTLWRGRPDIKEQMEEKNRLLCIEDMKKLR